MKRTGPLLRILASMLSFAILSAAGHAHAAQRYAVVDVNVVPMSDDRLVPGQTVLIEDGRITAMGPTGATAVPAGFERIEGQGRFLAPGLADMHAHPMTVHDLDLHLAAGVTFIRAMWGEPEVLKMRADIASGTLIGPRILTGGRIVDGEPVIHYGTDQVLTSEDAGRVVHRQQSEGYDFIKIYSNLSLEAFDAIASEAKSADIPFAGHVPKAVPMDHALHSGMLTSEHLLGINGATLVEGATEVWRFGPEFEAFAERIGAGDLPLEQQYDDAKLKKLAALAAETGHWLVPTLIVLRGTALAPEAMAREWVRREMLYTDFTVKSFWKQFTAFGPPKSADFYAGTDRLFEHSLRQVKAFHDAGANILAGTDAPNPFVYVGFSLVDELQLFVDAGLTPFQALQTATVNPATFIGEAGKSGIVAEGARADLALLDANPLEDVGAYRTLSGVIVNGSWLDRAELDRRLTEVVASNDRKAALFGQPVDWPLQEGEIVSLEAGFVLGADGEAGTERIGRAQAGEAVGAVLVQRRPHEGAAETWRLEIGEGGHVRRLLVTGANALEITRNETGYAVQRGREAPSRLDSTADYLLTGTAADALALRELFDSMADGETRTVDAVCLGPADELQPCALSIGRHPPEVIVGHFYFSGVNRFDLRVDTAGDTRNSRIWMGGGFYAGWPIRLELDIPGDDESLAYRRIL